MNNILYILYLIYEIEKKISLQYIIKSPSKNIKEYQRISKNTESSYYHRLQIANITFHTWPTDTIYTSSSHSIKQFHNKMISYDLQL